MPYIKECDREWLESALEAKNWPNPRTAGELNYCFTKILEEYYFTHKGYQGINDIVGALEGAKLEFYRRVAAPYEDEKMRANGDVY